MERLKKKICLLGDPSVGKTSLIRRFVLNSFDEKYLSTLGTHVTKKEIHLREQDTFVDMMVWDISGQKEMKHIHASGLRNAAGVILVADISRSETISDLKTWKTTVSELAGSIPILCLLNKADLCDDTAKRDQTERANGMGFDAKITSAKTGENVEKSFKTMAALTLSGQKADKYLEAKERDLTNVSLSVFEAEDEIIHLFVDIYGDEQHAMSVVRQQFKKRGVDFRDASQEDLQNLVQDLTGVLEGARSNQEISNTRRKMQNVLKITK